MNDLVLRENRDGAAILTLNRPAKLNALSKDLIETLEEHIDHIARETKTVGLVILRGAGGNFSSGHDMTEVLSQVKARAKPHHYVEVIDKVADLPQPVISAVRGTARPEPWSWRSRRISSWLRHRPVSPMPTPAGD